MDGGPDLRVPFNKGIYICLYNLRKMKRFENSVWRRACKGNHRYIKQAVPRCVCERERDVILHDPERKKKTEENLSREGEV
jgi:hypothetical protein